MFTRIIVASLTAQLVCLPVAAGEVEDLQSVLARTGVEADDLSLSWRPASPFGRALAQDPAALQRSAETAAREMVGLDLLALLGRARLEADGGTAAGLPQTAALPLRRLVASRREARIARRLDPAVASLVSVLAVATDPIAAARPPPDVLSRVEPLLAGVDRAAQREWAREIAAVWTPADGDQLSAYAGSVLATVLDASTALPTAPGAWPADAVALTTAAGRVWIGSPAADVFEAPFWLVLDPGGDDLYRGDGAAAPLSVIVDLAGDDAYHDPPTAEGGVALLLDRAGDDDYRGGPASLGAGVLGTGVLWDGGGDDRYDGGPWSLGAGTMGVGLLIDDSGDDVFAGRGPTQGVGGPLGVGVLVDRSGADHYLARGGGGPGAQGHGHGISPWLPGGLGLLVDGGGDDGYHGGDGVQGHGTETGVGVAVDLGGDDSWWSGAWSQGAARHRGIGVLVDTAGGDRFDAIEDAQGRAHDRSVGALADSAGDDRYAARASAQAVATANGLAFLVDAEGADSYHVADPGARWGATEPLRGRASVAVLLDSGGKDAYGPGSGLGDDRVAVGGRHGVGFDSASIAPALPSRALLAALALPAQPEEIAVLIQTAQRWRDLPDEASLAIDRLAMTGPDLYGHIRGAMDSTSDQQVVGLGRILDAIAHRDAVWGDALAARMEAELVAGVEGPAAEIVLVWWGRRVGQEVPPAVALPYVEHALPGARRAAVSVLGGACSADATSHLVGALAADRDRTVRAAAARALATCPGETGLAALAAALGDPDLDVRDNAARSLVARARGGQRDAVLSSVRGRAAGGEIPALEVLARVPDGRSQGALEALLDAPQPGVRGHAALALGGLRSSSARKALLGREAVESDPFVLWCLDRALRTPGNSAAIAPELP